MAIKDSKIPVGAATPLKPIRLMLGTTATSQTAKQVDGVKIPFDFKVHSVEVNALTVTAGITVDVQIGSTSVLASAITPVAATPTAGTLSTTQANRKGASGAVVALKYTSDGTGAATNGIVTVWVRPRPLNGEL